MNVTVRYICLIALALIAVIFVGCGSDESSADATVTVAETGHEGHDHGPGEHPTSEPVAAADWCSEHAVPESECTQCNPALVAQFKETGDWCGPHDLPESHCRLCNPGISWPQENDFKAAGDWCVEHAVPESECTQCNPTLIAGFKETGDWCGPHDLPESHCRLCNPGISWPQENLFQAITLDLTEGEIGVALNFRKNASVCATDGALIQFASSTTAERAGISVQPVLQSRRGSHYEAPAEIVFDETKTTAITSSVSALVTKWLVSPGDEVTEGQALGLLQSPEIASLRSELTAAYARYQKEQKELVRHEEFRARDLGTEVDYEAQVAMTEEARAEYVGARGMLLSAGLDDADLADMIEYGSLSNRFALRAPMDGLVIERVARLGDLLDAGSAFATIGDPQAMWIEAQFTESQIREIELGHQLVFASDGRGLNRVGGEIIWVSRFLDPHTRTGTVRARIIDPSHSLRAGEFGRATVLHEETTSVALVPKDAVQWEGCCNVVFVKESVDRFRPRKVSLIGDSGPYYQVDGGVLPGQEIVVNGAFLLKTELKKSSIGAGCCGLDPVG